MVIIGLRFDENLIRDGSCCFLDRTSPTLNTAKSPRRRDAKNFKPADLNNGFPFYSKALPTMASPRLRVSMSLRLGGGRRFPCS